MATFTFRGLCAPVFTVFNKDLSLNLDIIPKYAQFLSDQGIKGLLINGTTGEGMAMTVAERKAVTEHWLKAAEVTKQHVMVQVGGCQYPDVLNLAKHAEAVGANSILCLPELYYKPTSPTQLIDYLKVVGEAAPKTPLLYYNFPAMSNVNINMAKFLSESVGKLPTLHGIKHSSFDLDAGGAALRVNNGKFVVFLGANTLLAGAFILGFDSSIATSLNLLPQYGVNILKAVREAKVEKAYELQNKLSVACETISKYGSWVSSMKAAMNLLTPIDVGYARLPGNKNLATEEVNKLKMELKEKSLL